MAPDHVKHGWWVHAGEYAFEPKALLSRAAKLRRWIKARPEKEIVLVAHGYFNHYMTGDVREDGYQTTPWWKEAEIRTYTFDTSNEIEAYEGGGTMVDGEDGAAIKETEESLQRLKDQKPKSAIQNVNRPAERRESLMNFQSDKELPN